jgi:hypothetical protein
MHGGAPGEMKRGETKITHRRGRREKHNKTNTKNKKKKESLKQTPRAN